MTPEFSRIVPYSVCRCSRSNSSSLPVQFLCRRSKNMLRSSNCLIVAVIDLMCSRHVDADSRS